MARAVLGFVDTWVAGLSPLTTAIQRAAAIDAMEGPLPVLIANGVDGLDEPEKPCCWSSHRQCAIHHPAARRRNFGWTVHGVRPCRSERASTRAPVGRRWPSPNAPGDASLDTSLDTSQSTPALTVCKHWLVV